MAERPAPVQSKKGLGGAAGFLVVSLLLVSISAPVSAQLPDQTIVDPRFVDTPNITDRFSLDLGGFLIGLKSSAAAGVGSGIGSAIDLEELLKLDPNEKLFRIDGKYRFGRHDALAFYYFGMTRESEGSFDGRVDFLDLEFVGEFSAKSSIVTYGLTYRRSLVNTGRVDAGLSFGLNVFDLGVDLEGEVEVIGADPDNPIIETAAARESVIAPVPSLGLFVDYALAPRWLLGASAAVLNLDVGDYEGSFIETRITTDVYLSRHFGIGGGLSSTTLRVADTGENPWTFDYRYSGFLVYFCLAY